ncbi:MAG: hypothetical protein CM15mP59_6280 [Flavobacteriaceae bacterium]|nr:MAG: hypothetical protein CM15mP59_6280 [Flavobacteriaceae bacterium]
MILNPHISTKISTEFGYRLFSDVNSLFAEVDVIDIVPNIKPL